MADAGTDPLSELAHDLINAGDYTAVVAPSNSPARARELLGCVTPDQLLIVPYKSAPPAYAMLAGLWLWHDALSECHEIAQKSSEELDRAPLSAHPAPSRISLSNQSPSADSSFIPSTGSGQALHPSSSSTLAFWHAIMHRREGDFSNAKYWYARCRTHPVLATMGPFCGDVLNHLPADISFLRLIHDGWNPNAFVDLTEQVHRNPSDRRRAAVVELQKVEWRLLFDYCTRQAVE